MISEVLAAIYTHYEMSTSHLILQYTSENLKQFLCNYFLSECRANLSTCLIMCVRSQMCIHICGIPIRFTQNYTSTLFVQLFILSILVERSRFIPNCCLHTSPSFSFFRNVRRLLKAQMM